MLISLSDYIRKSIGLITNHKHYKHAKNFSKYLFVGVIWTILNIFLMWLLIDKMEYPTLYAATGVAVGLFVGKFYFYRLIGFMENRFLKYASTVAGFYITNIFLMWLFVDIVGLSAVISSSIIVVSLFVLRFIFFQKLGLIKS